MLCAIHRAVTPSQRIICPQLLTRRGTLLNNICQRQRQHQLHLQRQLQQTYRNRTCSLGGARVLPWACSLRLGLTPKLQLLPTQPQCGIGGIIARRGIRTSSRRSAPPILALLLMKQIAKLSAVITGRSVDKSVCVCSGVASGGAGGADCPAGRH